MLIFFLILIYLVFFFVVRVFKNAGEKIIDNLFPLTTNSNNHAKTVGDEGENRTNSNSKKIFEEMLKDLVRNFL